MKHAAKLFEPFQRLHREQQFPGHGIGLATVRKIVRLHGGEIWAEAEPGNGATFFFTLNCSPT
jgi:signal transduction histidine kinase